MGNLSPLTKRIGTIGELLTQIRLLEYEIEPTIPLIDSGNDIIAIKGNIVKYVQVKTRTFDKKIWRFKNLRIYHILVLIRLAENPAELDKADIYLLDRDEVAGRKSIKCATIEDRYRLSQQRMDVLFR